MSISCDGTNEVYNETFPTARKEHECSACQSKILPKHKYAKIFILYDGNVDSLKRCVSCQMIHQHLRVKCSSHTFGDEWPDERLNCGLTYESEWGELPQEMTDLAFSTPDQAQKIWEELK